MNALLFVFLYVVTNANSISDKSNAILIPDENSTKEVAHLENDNVKISFIKTKNEGKKSILPVYQIKTVSGWYEVPLKASSESYRILMADTSLEMGLHHWVHPKWKEAKSVKEKSENGFTKVVWKAGENYDAVIKKARQDGENRIILEFYPLEIGELKAIWELQPKDKTVKVEMQFTPIQEAQYSLGYFLFNSQPVEKVEELLMPMLVQRKRFPEENFTQLQASAPTPLSLMQTSSGNQTLSWGVSGEPTEVPFEFPIPIKSHYGLHIKNSDGEVQPSIFGPLLGTPASKTNAGETLSFSFRLFVQNADWYATYRDITDNLFGWYDYRKNGEVSMTDAMYNMIDLYMDDEYGGWWKRAKANYQIESKNGSTQSSPLTIASLYRLTGDTAIYRKRMLPTMEYILSRDNPHFSPDPENTGGYARGHMKGPVDIFGSTVYAGLWEMMNYRTPVFKDIAFPDGEIKPTTRQQNFIPSIQPYDELLGKYLFTGDEKALEGAIIQADKYIEENINKAPRSILGLNEFWLMAYTPNWEGLLRLYEITGEERFLDASEKAARITMTGMWTQPMPEDEMITIHEDNYVHGDKMDRWLHKGEEEFRLGFPREEGDVKEKKVPAWLVSHTGLGYETAHTYNYKDNGGRMITMANWAPAFLRLALYTGDKQFETYARNAAIGRMGNYGGYYYTTFTDLLQNPRYPYEGPDISFVYYHHIPVHLSWTIDYLVSEAKLSSKGAISFPGLRQFGYAFFDNLAYGHSPGKVFGNEGVWLWLDKDLVDIDNPQINYLTAHSGDKFFLIIMNESQELQTVNIGFNAERITGGAKKFKNAKVLTENNSTLELINNTAEVSIVTRGLTVFEVDDLDIEVETHKQYAIPQKGDKPYYVEIVCADSTKVRAASIQVLPEDWHAYIYSTAESKSLKKITLSWETGTNRGTEIDTDYPYEFSIPVPAGENSFKFRIEAVKVNGEIIETEDTEIGIAGH